MVFIYELSSISIINNFKTSNNPNGLCSAQDSETNEPIIAFLGKELGEVMIYRINGARTDSN